MNLEEALKLLRGGTNGVEEWNRRRKAGEQIPSLRGAKLSGTRLIEVNLEGADLREAELGQAILHQAKLDQADLREADLSRAALTTANLRAADLRKADLRKADLSAANLEQADLRDVKIDGQTNLENANVADCPMYRHALESLEKYGGLTKADRMGMRIIDGLAELRPSYSGFMQWLHLIALLVFVFPYVSFILKQWAIARFLPAAEETMQLWQGLLYYIWNGGEGWQQGLSLNPWSFGAFCVALIYNIMRAVLLVQTKKLEMRQEAIGLPVVFTLRGFWGSWHRWTKIGFLLNLAAVVWHTCHFMTQRVPIDVATT